MWLRGRYGFPMVSSYIICTAPRAGSTLLAEGLKATHRAGRPSEYFEDGDEQYWIDRLGIRNDADYVSKVIEAATTENGAFGLKLHWHQIPSFLLKLSASFQINGANRANMPIEKLIRTRLGDPQYVWLVRRNVVAQGISYCRAAQSGRWYKFRHESGYGINGPSRQPDQPPVFDFTEIDRHVRMIELFNLSWEKYFRRNQLSALVLHYEDLVRDYEPTIRSVLDYIGVRHRDLLLGAPITERQADDQSLEWEQRYLEILRRSRQAAPASISALGISHTIR